MQLIVSPQARDDLREAYRFVAASNPEAADRLLARIIDAIGFLASGSIQGRRTHLRDGREVETWPVPPYRLYYRKTETALEVIRIYHQSRRPLEG